jgi:hypothetical protein
MPPRAVAKAKKTFSLSREAVKYLENLRRESRAQSVSAVLEDLIRRQQQAREAARVSASITNYYDSLTDDQVAGDQAWGRFAEAELPTEE